ncbi:MAG: NAD(P)/FAD-dependent oxidoreductase [Bacteroidia bacterium]|nr:NAD(P)/FAD-dependent oxidoreductase [Bacteroidia bacterium]
MTKRDFATINLAGAGLAGSLMAVYLAQKGYAVNVYERRPDMRKVEGDQGRSINLALSVRGIQALRETGMEEHVMKMAIPMYGRMIHDENGLQTFQAYSRDRKSCIYSISRAELNKSLMTMAESFEGIRFHFNKACEEMDFSSGKLVVKDTISGEKSVAPGTITLACDGAFSAIRYDMQKTPRFDFSQTYLAHGYKELTIPPGAGGTFLLEKHALHIWPRGHFMMIALPNPDGSFTCTLFFPFEGEKSFANLSTTEAVHTFFSEYFPDTLPLIPDLLNDFFANPTSSLVTIRCYPWIWEDKVALIGDAAHAIVPFFGQGMNAAFEDCTVLNQCMEEHGSDWGKIFAEYQQLRKNNAEAIANMALENFVEMRDTVADERFLFRKKVEHLLGQKFGPYFSRYELVSFSRIPYEEAYRRGLINQAILDELTDGRSDLAEIDFEKAETLINERLGADFTIPGFA